MKIVTGTTDIITISTAAVAAASPRPHLPHHGWPYLRLHASAIFLGRLARSIGWHSGQNLSWQAGRHQKQAYTKAGVFTVTALAQAPILEKMGKLFKLQKHFSNASQKVTWWVVKPQVLQNIILRVLLA